MSRILVVEDDALIRRFVTLVLEQKSHEVVEAVSGGEALAILRRDHHFDLILTDLRLPKTDVLNYMDQLRQEFAYIPVILMSAHITSAWAVDAVQQAVAYVVKPFTRQQLLEGVEP